MYGAAFICSLEYHLLSSGSELSLKTLNYFILLDVYHIWYIMGFGELNCGGMDHVDEPHLGFS